MIKKFIPEVSIIIPTYNAGKHLEKLIQCIIRQTFEKWELIIVDDLSTDNTIEIIKKYTHHEDRIKYKSRDRNPKGAQTCRNIGLDLSTGKYIIFFDADDFISDTCIEQRVCFMNKNKGIDFGIFPAITFSKDANIKQKIYGIKLNDDQLKSFLVADYQFTVWTNIYRKNSLKNIKWDENVTVLQDLDFNISAINLNLQYSFCEYAEIDYYYRIENNKNNISSNFVSPEKNESTIYLFKKIIDVLRKRDDYKERKKEFFSFLVLHFNRLCMNGQDSEISSYIKFCKLNYNPYVANCLTSIYYTTRLIKSNSLKRNINRLMIFLLFPNYMKRKFFSKYRSKFSEKITKQILQTKTTFK